MLIFFAPQFIVAQGIPNEVKSTVAFIFIKDNSNNLKPNGTGFFVGIENPKIKDTYSIYLITAKHVLLDSNKKFLKEISIRLNTKDSLSVFLTSKISNSGLHKSIFTHEDPTVDIAVIPVNFDEKIIDYKFFTEDYLTSKKAYNELNIREGTEVFFTGLFTSFMGEKRNYPIVRFGRVALVTNEKIDWEGSKSEMYLIESSSYGGNSGSPVFFYFGADRGNGVINIGNPILKLAGVMKGYFGQKTPIEVINTKASIAVSVNNIGIAAVTPSYFIREILESPELKRLRGF